MMKWKLTKQTMDNEQEDIRKSLDILDQILSEYDCGEDASDSEARVNGAIMQGQEKQRSLHASESSERVCAEYSSRAVAPTRVRETIEKTEKALIKIQKTEKALEARLGLQKEAVRHTPLEKSPKREGKAPIKPVRKSLGSPEYRPVSLENILNRKETSGDPKSYCNGVSVIAPPPRPSKTLLYELHQHAPHCALRRHAGMMLQQKSGGGGRKGEDSSRDNSPDSLADADPYFVTSTAKKTSHSVRPGRIGAHQTPSTSGNRSDVTRKSDWSYSQKPAKVKPPPPEVAAEVLANLLSGNPLGGSPKPSSFPDYLNEENREIESAGIAQFNGFNQSGLQIQRNAPVVPKRNPLTRLTSTCSDNGSSSPSPVPSGKVMSPSKRNRNYMGHGVESSSPFRNKVSRHSSAPSQTGLFQYYIPFPAQNENKTFLRSYQPIRKFPEIMTDRPAYLGCPAGTMLSIKTDSGIDESLGYSPNSSLEDPHLNGNFSVHMRDKIRINPDIYLPTPPVPIPDYSDSEESEIMPCSMLDPGLVKNDLEALHKQTSSSTSVSDDSLLTSSNALKKNNAKNREFHSLGKCSRGSNESSFSDSDSLFSDDSLEAEQAFRKRKGKKNLFQKENLKTLEENITSDDSGNHKYSPSPNTGTNSLWSTSSFDYLPSGQVNVIRNTSKYGDKCNNFIRSRSPGDNFRGVDLDRCYEYGNSSEGSASSSVKSGVRGEKRDQLETLKKMLKEGLIEKTTVPPPNFTPPPPNHVRRHSIDSLWSSVSDKNSSSVDDPADSEVKSPSDDGRESEVCIRVSTCPVIRPPRKNETLCDSQSVTKETRCKTECQIRLKHFPVDSSHKTVIKLSANPLSRSALNIVDDDSSTNYRNSAQFIPGSSPRKPRPNSFVHSKHTSFTNLNYPDVLGFPPELGNLMRSESSLVTPDRVSKSLSPDPSDLHLRTKSKKTGLKKTMSALSDSFSKLKLPLGRQVSFENLTHRPHLSQKQLLTKHEMLLQRKMEKTNNDPLLSIPNRLPRITTSEHPYDSNPNLNTLLTMSSPSPSPEVVTNKHSWPVPETPATLPPNLSPTILRKEKDLKRSTSLLFANRFFGKSESSSSATQGGKKGFFQKFWKRKQYSLTK